jgi:hypothetical protein
VLLVEDSNRLDERLNFVVCRICHTLSA